MIRRDTTKSNRDFFANIRYHFAVHIPLTQRQLVAYFLRDSFKFHGDHKFVTYLNIWKTETQGMTSI